jgi:hypothetical protein
MRRLLYPVSVVAGRGFRSRRDRGALVATVGLLGSAAVAGAITPGEPFTVSPNQGDPFTVVNVSGANCADGPAPLIAGTVVGSPDVGVVAQFTATPDANGDWVATFTVPPNKPAGPYEVTATCMTDPNQAGGNDYGNQPFTILQGQPATMTVSPRDAQAGEGVTVTVSGTLCRGENAVVDIGIFVRVPEELGEADEFVARATSSPATDGGWASQLTIPAASAPGTYGVGAQCIVAGFQFFLYDTVDIVLSAPEAAPASPVVRQPSFTG